MQQGSTARSRASVDQLIRKISLPSVSSLSDMSSLSFPSSTNSNHSEYANGDITDAAATIGDNTENEYNANTIECNEAETPSFSENKVLSIEKAPSDTEKCVKRHVKPHKSSKEKSPNTSTIGGLTFWPAYLALLDREAKPPKVNPNIAKFSNIVSDKIPEDVNDLFVSINDRNLLNSTFNERLRKFINEEFDGILDQKLKNKSFNNYKGDMDKIELSYTKTPLKSISIDFGGNGQFKKVIQQDSENSNLDHYIKVNQKLPNINISETSSKPDKKLLLIRKLKKIINEYNEMQSARSEEESKHVCKCKEAPFSEDFPKEFVRKFAKKDESILSKSDKAAPFYDNLPKNFPGNFPKKESSFLSVSKEDFHSASVDKLNGLVNSGSKYHVFELANLPTLPKCLLDAFKTGNTPKLYLDVEPYGDTGFGRVKLSSNVGIYKVSLLDDNVDHFNAQNLSLDNWRMTSSKVLDKTFSRVSRTSGKDYISRVYGFDYSGVPDIYHANSSSSVRSSSSGGINCLLMSIQYKDSLTRNSSGIDVAKSKANPNSLLTVLPSRGAHYHDFITIPQANGTDDKYVVQKQLFKHGLIFELAQRIYPDRTSSKKAEEETFVYFVHPNTKQYLCLNKTTGHIQFRRISFSSFNFTHSPRTGKEIEWIPACFRLLPLYKYTLPKQSLSKFNHVVPQAHNDEGAGSVAEREYFEKVKERDLPRCDKCGEILKSYAKGNDGFGIKIKFNRQSIHNGREEGSVCTSVKQANGDFGQRLSDKTAVENSKPLALAFTQGNEDDSKDRVTSYRESKEDVANRPVKVLPPFNQDGHAKPVALSCGRSSGNDKLESYRSNENGIKSVSSSHRGSKADSHKDSPRHIVPFYPKVGNSKPASNSDQFKLSPIIEEHPMQIEDQFPVVPQLELTQGPNECETAKNSSGGNVNVEVCDQEEQYDDDAADIGCCVFDHLNISKSRKQPIKVKVGKSNSDCNEAVRVALEDSDDLDKFIKIVNSSNNTPKENRDSSKISKKSLMNLFDKKCIQAFLPLSGVADISITKLDIDQDKKKIVGDCGIQFSLDPREE